MAARGRFSASGGTGDQDQTLVEVCYGIEHRRKVQLLHGHDVSGDQPEDRTDPPVLIEEVAPETSCAVELVCFVHIELFIDFGTLLRR